MTSEYGICRVQKCKGSGVGAAQYHNDREHGNHNNPDIDFERSYLNYDLHNHGEYETEVADRINALNLTRKVRHDAVKLIDGICTASPTFFQRLSPEETRRYFEDCYEWACGYFGYGNMVAFTVHMDETTPHAHFEATPIRDGRLAWGAMFVGGGSYNQMQDHFYETVSKKWGLERGEVGTGRKHKSVAEYKRETYKETLQLADENKAFRAELDTIADKMNELRDKRAEIAAECSTLDARKESLQSDITGIQQDIKREEREAVETDAAIARVEAEINAERSRLNPEPIAIDETAELQQLDHDIRELNDAIPQWREAITGLTTRIQQITGEIRTIRERIKQLPELIQGAIENMPMGKKRIDMQAALTHVLRATNNPPGGAILRTKSKGNPSL